MTNTLVLVGRITRTPQTRNTGDKARTTFTLAVDGMGDRTDFIPITTFGRTAELVAQHTDKGHLVSIEGRITSGKYTNDNGETIYTLDVIANRVNFLSKPRTATTTPDTVTAEDEAA